MESTERCVKHNCRREATEFKGFLIKSRDKVIAGFCEEHLPPEIGNFLGKKGCYGIYDKDYGLKKIY